MPNIQSREQARANLPPAHLLGSADMGTVNPIIVKGTQLRTTLFQKGSRASVTKTGTVLHFSPAFSGTPIAVFSVRAFAPGSAETAGLVNPHSSGGTLKLGPLGGTKVVDYMAFDPTR